MRDILIVALFFFVIYHSFRRPYIGVCAWIWIAMMAPTAWAFGFSTSLRMNLTIVIITFLSYLFAFKNKKLTLGGVGWLMLLFLLQASISTMAQNTLDGAEVFGYFTEHLKTALLFIFVVLILRTKTEIITFIWCIIFSVSAYAAMEGLKFILSGGGHEVIGRAGVIKDRNDFAVAINMTIPLIFFLISVTEHKWLKRGLWLLAMLNVVAVVGTYSRGGFIGLCIIAGAAWLRSRHKLVLALAALLLLPTLYLNTPEEWRERQSTVSTAATEDGSFIGRLWAWKISTLIALDDPMTGGGYRAVTDPSLWHYYGGFTPTFGPVETPPIPDDLLPKAAHNIYFQVLGDHGFPGLILFLLILANSYLNNYRNYRFARKHDIPWMANLSSALNVSLLGYGITGLNVSLAYFDLAYASIGLVIVMNLVRQQQQAILLASQQQHHSFKRR